MIINYPVKAVTVKKLAELTGYSEAAINQKIQNRVFREGEHYFKSPDGRNHIILEAYNKWVSGQPASSRKAAG